MAYSARVVQLLNAANLLLPGVGRLDGTSWLQRLADNLPRSNYGQAYSDTDGTYARLPYEMLPYLIPGVDFQQEDPDVVQELIDKVYRPWVSVKADGLLQAALNGDGRSFLVDMTVRRSGQKLRGARYISDDPVAVAALHQARHRPLITSAANIRDLSDLIKIRRPELTDSVNARDFQSLQNVAQMILPGATVSQPPAALPTPTPDQGSEPPTAAAGSPAGPPPPADPSGPAGAAVNPNA